MAKRTSHASSKMGNANGNSTKIIKEVTKNNARDEHMNISFTTVRHVGSGVFGKVDQIKVHETDENLVVKKVLKDPRYHNRELGILRQMDHNNVVRLKYFYHTKEGNDEYIHMIMEYLPQNLHDLLKPYRRNRPPQQVPLGFVQLLAYQLIRGIAYLHLRSIAHRDLKPSNIVVDSNTGLLKICDLGSAKKLVKGELNVSYICSRFYRAPELIFEERDYTTMIDIWSVGCVFGEMLFGHVFFPGENNREMISEMIEALGPPTKEQILGMNPKTSIKESENNFEVAIQGKPQKFQKVFPSRENIMKKRMQKAIHKKPVDSTAIDLLLLLFEYNPSKRIAAFPALAHKFFDPLRDPSFELPKQCGKLPPEFLKFSDEEIKGMEKNVRETLAS